MKTWIWCLVLLAACKKHSGGGPAEQEAAMYKPMRDALVAPERRGPAFATTPAPLPAAAPAKAGPVYFIVRDVGLATFGVDGKVSLLRIPLGRWGNVAVAADGSAIVAASHVYKISNGNAEPIGGDESPGIGGMGSPVAVAPDGSIWIADLSGVSGWDGTKWTTYPTSETVEHFAFDGKGRVFTAGARQLGVIDGGTWKKMYDLEGTPHEGVLSNPRWGSIAVIGKELVATHSYGILKLDGANVVAVHRKVDDPLLFFGRFVGNEYVSLDKSNVVHTPLDGSPPKLVPITGSASSSVIAFDGRGRAWTSDGSSDLAMIDTSGAVTSWPAATIPEITSTVEAIAVAGNGPEKLPGQSAVAKGTLRGHVTNKGAAIANAYIEICQAPLDQFKKDETPCGYTDHGTGHTDASGVFSIGGLRLKDYSVVVKDGDQWYSLLGTTCGGMKDGETCDMGELDVTNKVFPTTTP